MWAIADSIWNPRWYQMLGIAFGACGLCFRMIWILHYIMLSTPWRQHIYFGYRSHSIPILVLLPSFWRCSPWKAPNPSKSYQILILKWFFPHHFPMILPFIPKAPFQGRKRCGCRASLDPSAMILQNCTQRISWRISSLCQRPKRSRNWTKHSVLKNITFYNYSIVYLSHSITQKIYNLLYSLIVALIWWVKCEFGRWLNKI